ncbi:hypothetical protein C8R45DRAFT_945165 [Mycena sanguinolenta]|nr:hypothetical protein C8R45DRAFT_945165 [Mycena sanguinolenta]
MSLVPARIKLCLAVKLARSGFFAGFEPVARPETDGRKVCLGNPDVQSPCSGCADRRSAFDPWHTSSAKNDGRKVLGTNYPALLHSYDSSLRSGGSSWRRHVPNAHFRSPPFLEVFSGLKIFKSQRAKTHCDFDRRRMPIGDRSRRTEPKQNWDQSTGSEKSDEPSNQVSSFDRTSRNQLQHSALAGGGDAYFSAPGRTTAAEGLETREQVGEESRNIRTIASHFLRDKDGRSSLPRERERDIRKSLPEFQPRVHVGMAEGAACQQRTGRATRTSLNFGSAPVSEESGTGADLIRVRSV